MNKMLEYITVLWTDEFLRFMILPLLLGVIGVNIFLIARELI